MSGYDYDDRGYSSRRAYAPDRRDDRDSRYAPANDYDRGYPSRALVPRAREDSDLTADRDYPSSRSREVGRARSAAPYYGDDYYDSRGGDDYYDRGYEPRGSRKGGGSVYYEEQHIKPKKGMSKQEKIIAAVAGAVIAAGGKELYDRHEAKTDHTAVHRNPLSMAAVAGVGALAAYQGAEFYSKQQAKKDQKANYILHRGRDGRVDEYYSDDDEGSQERKGHKNFLESALAATGLAGVAKQFTGQDDKSDDRSRAGDDDRSRSRSRGGSGFNRMQKAAVASLLAGAAEAFRVSKEPGGWKGEKTKRILTAAAGAATVDAATGANHGALGLAESVIGGLVGNRLINGSRNDIEEDRQTGRSRSRSKGPSTRSGSRGGGGAGLAALATAGLGALGVKEAMDRSRSRSQARDRGRSESRSRSPGYDSRDGSPDRRRSRSRSVVDMARSGLAKLGIGSGAGAASAAGSAASNRRRDQDDYGSQRPRGGRGYSDGYDDDDDEYGYDRNRGFNDERTSRGPDRQQSRNRDMSRDSSLSASELGDSDEDEKKRKKMRGKQLLTSGLAAVATIHAAHEVYESYEKRQARHKAVKEGRLSKEEAKKLKTKALFQDAGSVGIAALGIKGAFETMKEAREQHHECLEFKEEQEKRHKKRQRWRQKHNHGDKGDKQRSESWQPNDRIEDRNYNDGGGAPQDWRYQDGNPYAAVPVPPGRIDQRY